MVRLVCGDAVEVLAGLPERSVDAVVTDPPYGLAFMGRAWDSFGSGGRAFGAWCERWAAEALRVLRPGGHLLAFGGTRTYHRLVCGVEDAGFEVRDCVAWLYGSGFPKARGHLKPGFEPVVVARRPLEGTVAETVARYGTGALRVEACRLEGRGVEQTQGAEARDGSTIYGAERRAGGKVYPADLGRWPPNVVLDEVAAGVLDEQTGDLGSADGARPSRFFYVAKPDPEERHAGLGADVGLFAPEDVPARNEHPTVKPVALMRWLVRLVTPAGGLVVDPFAGSGTTLIAAALEGVDALGVEREPEYVRIARARLAHWAPGALVDDEGVAA